MDPDPQAMTEKWLDIMRDIYLALVGELIEAGADPDAVADGRARLRHHLRHRTAAGLPRLTEAERDMWTGGFLSGSSRTSQRTARRPTRCRSLAM